jgi:hypothetical protein
VVSAVFLPKPFDSRVICYTITPWSQGTHPAAFGGSFLAVDLVSRGGIFTRHWTSSRHFNEFIMRMFPRCAALLLVAAITPLVAAEAVAAEVFELEPEYVYGRNRKPQMGYRQPEVFDPLSDRLYQSGFRNFAPTAIPDELKEVPAMERVQKMGRILACADAWFWPFSRTARKNEPPGLEIEILQSIARKHGWDVSIAWVNTGMRFGVGVTFGTSIDRGICDIFSG